MYSWMQSTMSRWGDNRFFEQKKTTQKKLIQSSTKARNDFKARNHHAFKSEFGLEHPIFWKNKNIKQVWLPVLKPNPKFKNQKNQIYFIYSKRLENPNSWHLQSFAPKLPFLLGQKKKPSRINFIALCNNSVISKEKEKSLVVGAWIPH